MSNIWENEPVESANVFVKIKWLEKSFVWEHYFEISSWEEIQKSKIFNWFLIWISNSTYEFEWKQRSVFKLLFLNKKSGKKCFFDTSLNWISRNIINGLASVITEPKEYFINLELYIKKNKETKKEFKSVYMLVNWQTTNWKFWIEEQKEMIKKVKVNWEDIRDFEEFDKKLQYEVEKMKITLEKCKRIKSIEQKQEEFFDESKHQEIKPEDLPF